MSGEIMVPLDGTRFGEAALPVALQLARRDRIGLRLVAVWEPILPIDAWVPAEEERRAREERLRYIEEVTRKVGEVRGVAASSDLLEGAAADVLVRWADAEGMDRIVMSTHGRGPLTRAWLGSVADRVARTASVPVLLVRPDEERARDELVPAPSLRSILVPLDGSEVAEAALDRARLVGQDAGATRLTLLRVVPPLGLLVEPWSGEAVFADPSVVEELKQAAHLYLTRVAERVRGWAPSVTTELVVHDRPWAAIVGWAETHGTDLIALCTHGRGFVSRALLGSVADKVVRAAPVPVLLFHPPRAERGGLQDQEAGRLRGTD